MRNRPKPSTARALWGGFVSAAVATIAFISCSTLDLAVVVAPSIPGATFAGNKACLDCHTNYVRAFPSALTRGCIRNRSG